MLGTVGIVDRSSAMRRVPPYAPISSASRRRLAEWLVGSSRRDVERDLVLEALSHTHGNRTAAVLGVSVRTPPNKITEYMAYISQQSRSFRRRVACLRHTET
jgi:DNA-binding NtrC family response regulator